MVADVMVRVKQKMKCYRSNHTALTGRELTEHYGTIWQLSVRSNVNRLI